MGDDSTPRRVQPGSVFRGHTSEDASDLSDTAPSMYRVTSSNASRSSWTCNGDHVLVLQFNEPPSAVDVDTRGDHTHTFCFRAFTREQDGEVVHKAFDFSSRDEAEQARAQALAEWRPLVWECTVDQFLACSDAVREGATMFQPDLVQFPPPSNTLLKRLSAAVETRPEQLSESLVKHTGSFAITVHSIRTCCHFLCIFRAKLKLLVCLLCACLFFLGSVGARCVAGRRLGGCASTGQDLGGLQSRRAHPATGRVVRRHCERQFGPCDIEHDRAARQGSLGRAWTGV